MGSNFSYTQPNNPADMLGPPAPVAKNSPTVNGTRTTRQQPTFKQELLTLEEVYQIEFGTRAMWKIVFSNGPEKYSKAMLAQSINEVSRDVVLKSKPAGNWYSFVPEIQHQGSLSCILYDDRVGTIEKWARNWWASTNQDQTYHKLQYPTEYVSSAYVYHYNLQHELIFSRMYIVLPTDAINVGFDSGNPTVSTVKLNFRVAIYQDL